VLSLTIWKDVIGYEGHYQVSDSGNVISVKKTTYKFMRLFNNKQGYPRVTLSKNGKMKQVFVHRLVAKAFIGDIPEGYTVNHIDGNKTNNNLSNLEIVTYSENNLHACYTLGSKLKPVEQLSLDGEFMNVFDSITTASKLTGTTLESIVKVCKGRRNKAGGFKWRYLNQASGGY
jgi:hypothetical protein